MLASDLPPKVLVAILFLFLAWLLQGIVAGIFNTFFHLLAAFPGPYAAALTAWYKTYQEVFLGRSWIDVLHELHKKHGMRHMSCRS
jgi:hypothetical protein